MEGIKREKSGKPGLMGPLPGSLKDVEQKRRQVFKPILDNPYTQTNQWPEMDQKAATDILDLLCLLLLRVGKYSSILKEANEKKKVDKSHKTPDAPAIQSQMTIGFNSTVKKLESQASCKMRHKSTTKKHKKLKVIENSTQLKYIFVAKSDIQPALLTQSFPVLSFTASESLGNRIKLVELPKGAMNKLSESLNMKNIGIIGLTNNAKEAKPLYDLVNLNITDIDIPWLSGIFDESANINNLFHKPAVKMLLTSAPIIPKKNDQKKKRKNVSLL